jgi:hypothetical protein
VRLRRLVRRRRHWQGCLLRAERHGCDLGAEDRLAVPEHAACQQHQRDGADAYRYVHQQQAADDDSGDENSNRQGNEESAEPDHVRSPRAVQAMRQLVSCRRLMADGVGACGVGADGLTAVVR